MSLENRVAERNNQSVGGGDDHGHALGAADVESAVIVNRAARGPLPAIDEGRLIRHLRTAGEPALPHRIDERAWLDIGVALGPEPQTGVFVESPKISAAVAVRAVAAGDRTIDLDRPDHNRQLIVAAPQRCLQAIDQDVDFRPADGVAYRVARLAEGEQLYSGNETRRQLDILRLADSQIDDAQERKERAALRRARHGKQAGEQPSAHRPAAHRPAARETGDRAGTRNCTGCDEEERQELHLFSSSLVSQRMEFRMRRCIIGWPRASGVCPGAR